MENNKMKYSYYGTLESARGFGFSYEIINHVLDNIEDLVTFEDLSQDVVLVDTCDFLCSHYEYGIKYKGQVEDLEKRLKERTAVILLSQEELRKIKEKKYGDDEKSFIGELMLKNFTKFFNGEK